MKKKSRENNELKVDRLFRRSLRRLLGEGLLRQEVPRAILLRGQVLQTALNAMMFES